MSSKVEKLVESLYKLKNFNNSSPKLARESHADVDNLLDLIFDIGRKRTKLTEEQKTSLGRQIADAIKPIQLTVERAGCEFRTCLDQSVLRKRSAIEFLVKDFGDIPVGDIKLSEKLANCDIQETIDILDEIIDNWRGVNDSDEEVTDKVFVLDSHQPIRNVPIAGVPISHTWWE